jgi:hypothetical protein
MPISRMAGSLMDHGSLPSLAQPAGIASLRCGLLCLTNATARRLMGAKTSAKGF